MPVKSIVDVEVNDLPLDRALRKYKEMQAAAAAIPKEAAAATKAVNNAAAATQRQNRAAKETEKTVKATGTAVATQAPMMRRAVAEQVRMTHAAKVMQVSWSSIKQDTKATGDHLKAATSTSMAFAKRLGLVSAIGGLIGVGGSLWGLDHLAASAASGRRSSTGMGLSYGQQQAFAITYGRLLDPGSFLGGVSQGRGNLAGPQAAALYSLGLNPAGPGNTGQHASDALSRVRQLTLRTPEHLLGTLLQTHRLGDLGLGTEDLRRIRSASPQEFDQFQQEYKKRSGQFDVSDDRMKAWQDLNVTLATAMQKIKSVFIDGLVPLAKPLADLSEGFSDLVRSFLGGQGFKDLMKSATEGLKDFAHYVAGPKFRDDVVFLVRTVADLASGFARLLGIIGGGNTRNNINTPRTAMAYEEWVRQREAGMAGQPDIVKDRVRNRHQQSYREYLRQLGHDPSAAYTGTPGAGGGGTFGQLLTGPGGTPGAAPVNNPGNLRPVGQSTGFMQYRTPQDGLQAMAKNLLYYQDRLGKNTIRDIVSTWAPPSENDTAAYIKNVSSWTQMGPDQKLDLRDKDTMAKLMAAMIRQEGNGANPNYQRPVIIQVLNNTGGNAIVQTSQMGFPQ